MEFELVHRVDRLGRKVLSCFSAECQPRTGPSVGSQAPGPFPEFQAPLLFSLKVQMVPGPPVPPGSCPVVTSPHPGRT